MSTCHWTSGWLALRGVAILISLSVPFSLRAHLVPLTNEKIPRSSTKCPKSRGSRGEESFLNPKAPTPLFGPTFSPSFPSWARFSSCVLSWSSVSWDASDLLRTCPCGISLLLVEFRTHPAEFHPLSASKNNSLLKFSEWLLPFEVLEIASFLLVVVVVVVFFFFLFLVFL